MIIHNFKQRSPEWFKIREGRITGSEASQFLSTGAGFDTLMVKKTLEIQGLAVKSDFCNADMQRGIDDEPLAIAAYEQEEWTDVTQVGFIESSKHFGWLRLKA